MSKEFGVLSYQDFKNLVISKNLFWQYTEDDKRYTIFANDGNILYTTYIWKDTTGGIANVDSEQEALNKQDFEENYKPIANRPLVVSPSSTLSWFEGKQIEIPDGESSGYCEWIFDKKVFINKVLPITIDAEWGDYVEMTMHLVSDDTQVGQYAKTVYLYAGHPTDQWFYGIGGGEIPYGVKVRCTYHKTNTSGVRRFIIIAEFLI